MTEPAIRQVIIVILSENDAPLLAIMDNPEVSTFNFGTDVFSRTPCPDWIGFYDWLRDDKGKILGVSITIDEPGDFDFGIFLGMKGVATSDAFEHGINKLVICFSTARTFSQSAAVDQDFGGNRIYIGRRASVAITFYVPWTGIEGLETEPLSPRDQG